MFRFPISILSRSCTSRHQPRKLIWHSHDIQRPHEQSLGKRLFTLLKSNRKGARKSTGDKDRINIINTELCDNVLERLAPSLKKHRGCDIIDVNPGVCMWSSKLHKLLKPRTHILLESDADAYEPYIQPLLKTKGSTFKLIPESGILWSVLDSLQEHLPHHVPLEHGDPRQNLPNNTLLFVANLGYTHGRKRYGGFSSIPHLVVHQLMSACRNHSVFQRYGLIRMLVWMHDKEKLVITPRFIGVRTKYTVEAELTCEHIVEVASTDGSPSMRKREDHLELERAIEVVKKMKKEGIKTPEGRAGKLEVQANQRIHEGKEDLQSELGGIEKAFWAKLVDSEQRFAAGKIQRFVESDGVKKRERTPEYHELVQMRGRMNTTWKNLSDIALELKEYAALVEKGRDIHKLPAKEKEERMNEIQNLWEKFKEERLGRYHFTVQAQVLLRADDRRAFYHDPPTLYWDRRPYQPLLVHKEDFFPEHELALLDFQPKAIDPIFRDPSNYDHFEFLVSNLFSNPTQSLMSGLQSTAPGALEWLVPECPSLTDVARLGYASPDMLRIRTLTQEHWRDLLTAWKKWPFRPDDGQIIARIGSLTDEEVEEDEPDAAATDNSGR